MSDSFGIHSVPDVLAWLSSTPLTQEAAVVAQARRIVLDTVGCAYAGSRADSLVSLQDACARVDPGHVRLGNGPGLSVGAAAQLFAYAACWDEACEGHAGAHGRPGVATLATVYCANRAPATAIQAQFSLTFGLAAALRFGSIDHETYRPAQFNDPELRRLESLVEVAVDPDLTARQTRGATLRVLVNGQWLEATVATILGDAALPLTDAQVIEKFISYAQGTVGVDAAHRIANDLLYGDLDVPYTGLLV